MQEFAQLLGGVIPSWSDVTICQGIEFIGTNREEPQARGLLYGFAMTRVLIFGFALLTAACGGKSFESLCANQVPAPAACNTPCDPVGSSACPAGFHCAANAKCDTFCTQAGNECGDGYSCTADGYCIGNGKGGDPAIDADCPAYHFTATKTIPSIQLLIDRSGSMLHNFADQPPMGADPVKFTTEQTALVGPQGVVTQLQDAVYFGASMYPSNVCPGIYQTANGRVLNNTPAIEALLMAHPPDPNANTPTPASIDLAVQDFMARPAPQGSPPVIVLATDGLPNNCGGGGGGQAQTDTITAARNAFSKGIRLYLLSVGTKIDPTFALAVANAGQGVRPGQPDAKPYTATNPAELSAKFQEIVRGVVSCDLKLSGRVDAVNGQSGSVTLNGMSLTYGTDWTLDMDGVTIHLLGNACNTLKSSPNPIVDATFGCGAVIF